MLFPRTIRLDASDLEVFEPAAGPDEWAVTGSFHFLHDDAATLTGKRLQAFRSGFLSTESFGWSTLVTIADIGDEAYGMVLERLARQFVAHYGAPDFDAALPVAREEAQNAANLCEHDPGTLLAIERELSDEGVIERLRVVAAADAEDYCTVKLWEIDGGN